MTAPNHRAITAEGWGRAPEVRPTDEQIVWTPGADAHHCPRGAALTFRTTEVIGGAQLVTLTGAIDASNSGWLSSRLTTTISGGAVAAEIVVDLSRVGFCDASGIAVLVKALKRCRRGQGALELAGAHGKVARVLRLTGVDQVLPLHTDLDSAFHAIARQRSALAQVLPQQAVSERQSESGGGEDDEVTGRQ